MLDGRHTGTGGGNHFVLGGATPADSPFLRRPDLLRSLVGYWHNHPSLSYLFSGLFIGPTSQAPRVDEARNDACTNSRSPSQMPPARAAGVPPWLVDRVLRNLLIDVTGNTHRAEFCIDKLYSPDGPTGRLGLLEMRAFEMPPHARMSLPQQLLLRGAGGALLEAALRAAAGPLGHRAARPLHAAALRGRISAMSGRAAPRPATRSNGLVRAALRVPLPEASATSPRAASVELRQALEPWHVLGEEGAAGGTVRYVDSSVERLQVKVTRLCRRPPRAHLQRPPLPLQPTGRRRVRGGVRYRAWQPPSCLHPTIGVHAPLTFDLVDTWMPTASMGGCQYHVAHPGGRNYDTFPVNAFEAEAAAWRASSAWGIRPALRRPV
jgi:uncharacterized protein (DUF2126 family)